MLCWSSFLARYSVL
uniref:Uncharacterized protein n=1 Tax=Arundo donax TaxID=35708 RepID=A0A0A9BWF8_ARUDO